MLNEESIKAINNSGAKGGWKGELKVACYTFGDTRVDGKVASNRTRDILCATLFAGFKELHELGYRVMPRNFGNRHMQVLVDAWCARNLSVKTMVTNLTQFRKFASWFKKDGMIRDLAFYLPKADPRTLKVRAAATESKSWTSHGLDVLAEIQRADAIDLRFGCMLRLMYAFGYRRKECLMCDPWVAEGLYSIAIFAGEGKGNRPRNIPMDSPGQRQVIEYIKTIVKKGEKVGWGNSNGQPKDYKKNYDRFGNLMKKMGFTKAETGVTGHCLRAEYSEDLALRLGFIPPSLGGVKDQMPNEDRIIVQKKVSEALGHSDPDKTAAYYGGIKLMKENSKKLRDVAALKSKIINEPKNKIDPDATDESDDGLTVS